MKRQTSLTIALMLATTAAQSVILPPGSPPVAPDVFSSLSGTVS
jgi:hypothetical protein